MINRIEANKGLVEARELLEETMLVVEETLVHLELDSLDATTLDSIHRHMGLADDYAHDLQVSLAEAEREEKNRRAADSLAQIEALMGKLREGLNLYRAKTDFDYTDLGDLRDYRSALDNIQEIVNRRGQSVKEDKG